MSNDGNAVDSSGICVNSQRQQTGHGIVGHDSFKADDAWSLAIGVFLCGAGGTLQEHAGWIDGHCGSSGVEVRISGWCVPARCKSLQIVL